MTEVPGNSVSWFTSVRGDPADQSSRKFIPGVHPKHKKRVSIKDIPDGFQLSNESHDWNSWKFGQLVHLKQRWIHWHKKSKPWFWIPRRETTPHGQGKYCQMPNILKKMLTFPNFKIWKLKSCNMSGNSFHISKSPDIEKIKISKKIQSFIYKVLKYTQNLLG